LRGIAELAENADEAPPRDLSRQFGHQLDFKPRRVSAANDGEVS